MTRSRSAGSRPYLSVVVPVYNEEESIGPLYEQVRSACDLVGRPYEVIIVDDGSRDTTYERLAALQAADPRVVVIRFRDNFGQTSAMLAGFRAARGDVVVSMDGDLQNDPADIPRLLARLGDGFDVVCGWRKDRKDKLVSRRIPSRVANWLIGRITGVAIHDNGCSLKAFRADVIKQVALYAEFHRFIPAMATLAGARVAELEVRHHARRFGRSKYGISRVWRVFLDLFLVKMITGFAARPAIWFLTLSVPAAGAFAAVAATMAIAGTSGVVLPLVGILALALAGHLVALGVMSEFLLNTGDFRPGDVLVAALGDLSGDSLTVPRRQ